MAGLLLISYIPKLAYKAETDDIVPSLAAATRETMERMQYLSTGLLYGGYLPNTVDCACVPSVARAERLVAL